MTSRATRPARLALVVAPLLGIAAAALFPVPDATFAAGLMTAVLTIVITSMVGSATVVAVEAQFATRMRAVVERLIPRAAQSDPDARGHARPRAPGVPLPAV